MCLCRQRQNMVQKPKYYPELIEGSGFFFTIAVKRKYNGTTPALRLETQAVSP